MRYNLLKTRRYILENKIKTELDKVTPNLENILKSVDSYEEDNLNTITKLKKEKQYTTKRISGALKSTITAHGPITKLLIGSATKRVYGNLLTTNTKPETKTSSTKITWIIIQVIIIFISLLVFIFKMS